MEKEINRLAHEFEKASQEIQDLKDFERVRKTFFGKESVLTKILKKLPTVELQNRQRLGQMVNELRQNMTAVLNQKNAAIQTRILEDRLKKEQLDFTLPGMNLTFGTIHPLNLVMEEIKTIFQEIGFEIVTGTEVESDEFNFQKLNLPIGHPARDMQDTFYLNSETVLRTHATNMTAHYLTSLSQQGNLDPYLAVISAGNVYRRDDDDATHSHQFMQIDGFALASKISFANLKWVLEYLCRRLFGATTKIRLRPSYFPFTEPSVEVDISCFNCQQNGCTLCKQTGWIEILGAGLINEQVLKLNGLDPTKVSALAFGVGLERIAMLKFGVTNIRSFYENNVKFLKQFKFYGE